MPVSEELGKKDISWEHFVVASHFKLDVAATPQSQNASPLSSTSVAKAGTNKKRKGRFPVQVSEVIKQVPGTEEEVCHSPQRDFSPPPPPELKEVPSTTKIAAKKEKNLHFSSSPPAANTKGRKPFTRSSIPKEVFEEQSLPKTPIKKKKGKGIDKPMERKEKTLVQKKKDKGKGIKKPDETDKAIPMQREEETMQNPIETVHVTTPDSQTFKRLIRQLRDARKEVAQLKTEAMSDKVKMKELMDGYSHTLDLARFAARKAQPLHRQLKNLYRTEASSLRTGSLKQSCSIFKMKWLKETCRYWLKLLLKRRHQQPRRA
jgi:hypothetical protein